MAGWEWLVGELCKHEWEIKIDKLVPSLLERCTRQLEFQRVPLGITDSTHIVIMVCKKCGAIDKTITKC